MRARRSAVHAVQRVAASVGEVLWQDGFAGETVGSSPPFDGFGSTESQNGGSHTVEFTSDGTTKGFRATMPSGASATQRAEVIPTNQPADDADATGVVFWRCFDLWFSAWTAGADEPGFGPLLMQFRRTGGSGLGNGPVSLEIRDTDSHLVLVGASGQYPSGLQPIVTLPAGMVGGASDLDADGQARCSMIDLGTVPTSAKSRIVIGVLCHPTDGWVEVWRDGSFVGKVDQWVSWDTSADGDGDVASTISPNQGNTCACKYGGYRGRNSNAVTFTYSHMVHTTTRAADPF
jgi:hypothetical protein